MSSAMFLSAAELSDLTDTRVRALQMEWLDRNRWPYTTSRMGNPNICAIRHADLTKFRCII